MKPISIRPYPLQDRWCVHSYYTTCPYAPDGSGRILAAGANLQRGLGEVLILSSEGEVLDRFGQQPLQTGFYHTGWWQTWNPDARSVYYQAGTLQQPRIGKYDVASQQSTTIEGDMEGAPPTGEPILSGLMGMLYAAGYGGGTYNPEQAPVPFHMRDRHGVFAYRFNPPEQRLCISVESLYQNNIDRERIQATDRQLKERLGAQDGLTLMTYCVRWSPDGSRFLFFFGNHNAWSIREEPKIMQVITSDRDMTTFHTALDSSYSKRGVHWSWQADNEHLIGYAGHPDDPSRRCLAEVRFDGTGFRMLSEHDSGGHPSTSPTNPDLIVTDENCGSGGAVVFISKSTGEIIERVPLPKYLGESEPPGRNPQRVCHHPVFHPSGRKILCNSLPGKLATLVEIEVPQ